MQHVLLNYSFIMFNNTLQIRNSYGKGKSLSCQSQKNPDETKKPKSNQKIKKDA